MDLSEGFGTYIYGEGDFQGDSYKGLWTNDEMTGLGLYYHADGRRYEGEFVEGNQQGLGTFFDPQGKVTEGEWEQD